MMANIEQIEAEIAELDPVPTPKHLTTLARIIQRPPSAQATNLCIELAKCEQDIRVAVEDPRSSGHPRKFTAAAGRVIGLKLRRAVLMEALLIAEGYPA